MKWNTKIVRNDEELQAEAGSFAFIGCTAASQNAESKWIRLAYKPLQWQPKIRWISQMAIAFLFDDNSFKYAQLPNR